MQLIKVNAKDQRVVVNERDLNAKFSANEISFNGPPEVFWDINPTTGKATVIEAYGPVTGTCRKVDD